MSYYYKNVNISDLFATGSSSIDTSYENFPTFSTTTNLAAKIDTVIPYQISGSSITDIYSISGNSETLNTTGNFTLPSWCDAVKTIIETSPGAQGPTGPKGDTGPEGATNNLKVPIGFKFLTYSGFPYAITITMGNYTAYGGPGGPGGNGGAGGPGGPGINVELQTPYVFNSDSFSSTLTTNSTTLTDNINGTLITANSGQDGPTGPSGGKGGSGNNGNINYANKTKIPGSLIFQPGIPIYIYGDVSETNGNTGPSGSDASPSNITGPSGSYTSNLNNYTIQSNNSSSANNSCQLYYFLT